MGVSVFEILCVETDGSFGVISIRDLTHKPVIDAEQEIGPLSIHTQEIIHIQTLNALLHTFCQRYDPAGRAFEHLPFLGGRRDGEGIIVVTRATEHQAITIITIGCGSSGNSISLQLNGCIWKVVLFSVRNANDRSSQMWTFDLDVIILWFVIADEIIIELGRSPTRARIRKYVLIQHSPYIFLRECF